MKPSFLIFHSGEVDKVDKWANIIATVGFPIAACVALFYFMLTMIKEHKEEIDALRSVLEQNTIALVELKNSIEEIRGVANG